MKNPIKAIDEKLRKKYSYSQRVYEYVKYGLIGWSITLISFVLWIIRWA